MKENIAQLPLYLLNVKCWTFSLILIQAKGNALTIRNKLYFLSSFILYKICKNQWFWTREHSRVFTVKEYTHTAYSHKLYL